jgi:RimJ/RimL family protein N-acetyltransferase
MGLPAADAEPAPRRLETARMLGEAIGPAHQDELAALLGDPRVGATLGGVLSPDAVADGIAHHAAHWDEHGFGYWLFRDRLTGALAARGGLHLTHIAGRDEVEVGWTVAPQRWGEGLATELGAAAAGVAFGPLGCADIVAFTLPDNVASRRVMEKLGFAYERDTEYKGWDHVLYRLQAPASPR